MFSERPPPLKINPKDPVIHQDSRRQEGSRPCRNKAQGDSGFEQDFRVRLRQENIEANERRRERKEARLIAAFPPAGTVVTLSEEVPTELFSRGQRHSSGLPLPAPLQAPSELCKNAENIPGSGSHPSVAHPCVGGCGKLVNSSFPRCSKCFVTFKRSLKAREARGGDMGDSPPSWRRVPRTPRRHSPST